MRFSDIDRIDCWSRGESEFGDLFCMLHSSSDDDETVVATRLETGKPWMWNRSEYEEARVWEKFGPSSLQQVIIRVGDKEIYSHHSLHVVGGPFTCEVSDDGYRLVCEG